MKKIFTIINLVVIFFIIDFSISALYEYFAREIEIDDYFKALAVQQQKIEKKPFQNQSYYTKIAARDLFKTGEEIKEPEKKPPVKPVAPPPKEIQVTKLNLELKGTVTGTGSEPFAIIEERGKRKERLYKEGDAVDRAVIKLILRQRVILLVDGRGRDAAHGKKQNSKKF
jgi:general secretion pathway protein C